VTLNLEVGTGVVNKTVTLNLEAGTWVVNKQCDLELRGRNMGCE